MDSPHPRRAVLLTSQSDERLVALARAGHERAFVVIVERYRPELYALARRLSSDGNGEDVVQQAFLGAFAALRSGAEVNHLRGWLYRIVRNAAARSRAPVHAPLDGLTTGDDAVEDLVQQRALARDALAALARLPSRQREAIVGTVLDGRARAEVASSMGLSEGAVRQLIHRARARLRTVVTALTPWPLARWIAGGAPGGGNAVEAVAGAGAATTGGVAGLKLGLVLATGAIATGVAAVDVHGTHHPVAARPAARAAASRGHPRAAARHVRVVEAAAIAAPIVAAPVVAAPVVAAPKPTVVTRSRVAPLPRVVPAARARPARTRSTVVAARRPDRRGGEDVRTVEHPQRHDGGGTDAPVKDAFVASDSFGGRGDGGSVRGGDGGGFGGGDGGRGGGGGNTGGPYGGADGGGGTTGGGPYAGADGQYGGSDH